MKRWPIVLSALFVALAGFSGFLAGKKIERTRVLHEVYGEKIFWNGDYPHHTIPGVWTTRTELYKNSDLDQFVFPCEHVVGDAHVRCTQMVENAISGYPQRKLEDAFRDFRHLHPGAVIEQWEVEDRLGSIFATDLREYWLEISYRPGRSVID